MELLPLSGGAPLGSISCQFYLLGTNRYIVFITSSCNVCAIPLHDMYMIFIKYLHFLLCVDDIYPVICYSISISKKNLTEILKNLAEKLNFFKTPCDLFDLFFPTLSQYSLEFVLIYSWGGHIQ